MRKSGIKERQLNKVSDTPGVDSCDMGVKKNNQLTSEHVTQLLRQRLGNKVNLSQGRREGTNEGEKLWRKKAIKEGRKLYEK